MRKEKAEQLRAECKNLMKSLEKVERQIDDIGGEIENENEMKHLARLIYAGKIIEQSGLLYSFNEQSLLEMLTVNKSKLEKPLE